MRSIYPVWKRNARSAQLFLKWYIVQCYFHVISFVHAFKDGYYNVLCMKPLHILCHEMTVSVVVRFSAMSSERAILMAPTMGILDQVRLRLVLNGLICWCLFDQEPDLSHFFIRDKFSFIKCSTILRGIYWEFVQYYPGGKARLKMFVIFIHSPCWENDT